MTELKDIELDLSRFRTRVGAAAAFVLLAFGLLGVTLVIAWLVPTSWLLGLPIWLRALAAIAIAFGPVFASNIVFATRFADTEDPTGAFAANLLGAMVGGCLEYVALITGYPILLLIAGVLYAGAFILGPRVGNARAGASRLVSGP